MISLVNLLANPEFLENANAPWHYVNMDSKLVEIVDEGPRRYALHEKSRLSSLRDAINLALVN
jgi:hypothetical protein